MQPLSNDLRERIIAAVDDREGSRRQIAVRFCVDVSTITRLLQLRRQTGSLEPRPHGGGQAIRPSIRTAWSDSAISSRSTPMPPSSELREHLGHRRQPHDRLAGPEEARHHPQEEDHARRRAGPTRGPGEATFVPSKDPADRAQEAGLRGRDRGHDGDDAHLRPGPAWRAGDGLGPGLVGVGDGDRGLGAGRASAPRWRSRGRPTRRRSRPTSSRCLVPALHAGDVVVFDNLASHFTPGGGRGDRAGGCERAAVAAVQPGFQPDRGDVLEVQGVPPPSRGADQGPSLRRDRRGVEAGHARGHPRLVPTSRLVCNPNVNRSIRPRSKFVERRPCSSGKAA